MVAFSNCYPYRPRRVGEIVAWGPPEDIVKAPRSYTGKFLSPVLAKAGKQRKPASTSEVEERA